MIPDELKRAKPMTGKERLGQTRDSDYLGAEDLDDSIEPVLTIQHIYNAVVTLQRGKERKDVITFAEESVPGIKIVRPLIVNATNRKTLRKIYRSVTAESLEGKKIQLYLEHNVRDPSTGDKVDGIRIRNKIPTAARTEPILCENCGKPIAAFGKYSAEQMAQIAKTRFKRVLCVDCINSMKEMEEAKPAEQTETENNNQEEKSE